MGKVHDVIDESVRRFIEAQHVFFVATAGLGADSTVNVSPKGTAETSVVLDELRFAYLDLTGSGIETVAHLTENGRITVMWCAFDGPARIVRLHGRGEVVTPGDPAWSDLRPRFRAHRGGRAIVVVTADRISDSCGYAVPLMDHRGDRERLNDWTDARSDEELVAYRAEKNARSIDGLPGIGLDTTVSSTGRAAHPG